tara:strand:- start:1 stop:270 length:270 start_codon:yes stop_codon:yes gene_type:complete
MESQVAQRFASQFQPQQESHVLWMKRVMASLNEMMSKKVNILNIMNTNPMEVKMSENDIMDIVFIQFSLAMKYTKAILDGEAWVPPQKV